MSLSTRKKDYKALTVINLPFIERRFQPGDPIPVQALVDAKQTDEDVKSLVDNGQIGDETDEIHPDHAPVNPNADTPASIVARAKAFLDGVDANDPSIPAEIRELAKLDLNAVAATDEGRSGEQSA